MSKYENISMSTINVNDKYVDYMTEKNKLDLSLSYYKYLLDNPKEGFDILELKQDSSQITESNIDRVIKMCKKDEVEIETLIEEYLKLYHAYHAQSKQLKDKKMTVTKYD